MNGVYTIHDTAAKYYMPPFIASTDKEAERMFITALGPKFPHRQDYVLYKIAEWDHQECNLQTCVPQALLHGKDIDPAFDPNYHAQGELMAAMKGNSQ